MDFGLAGSDPSAHWLQTLYFGLLIIWQQSKVPPGLMFMDRWTPAKSKPTSSTMPTSSLRRRRARRRARRSSLARYVTYLWSSGHYEGWTRCICHLKGSIGCSGRLRGCDHRATDAMVTKPCAVCRTSLKLQKCTSYKKSRMLTSDAVALNEARWILGLSVQTLQDGLWLASC
jgi:hypothetical protein